MLNRGNTVRSTNFKQSFQTAEFGLGSLKKDQTSDFLNDTVSYFIKLSKLKASEYFQGLYILIINWY
jgi:hypothetical protein